MKIKRNKWLGLASCFMSMTILLAGCTFPNFSTSGDKGYVQNTLSKVYADYFSVGAAVEPYNLERYDEVLTEFNSLTCENKMKWRNLEPTRGQYTYEEADFIVNYAKKKGKKVRGHCLLWYKSLPTWVREVAVDKQSALSLIDGHVKETVRHFGNSIYAWDVVNEALKNWVTESDVLSGDIYRLANTTDNLADPRVCDWYGVCGDNSFIKQAFISAAETREQLGIDPEAMKLYYNDYGLNNPFKRQACVMMAQEMLQEGIPVEGIGMQGHYRLPDYLQDKEGFMTEFENSVKAFTELGLDVQITELDVGVYAKDETNAHTVLPENLARQQAEMYADIFAVCRKYSKPWKEGAGKITNVTTWGVADDHTGKPFSLLFDKELEYKQAYHAIVGFED